MRVYSCITVYKLSKQLEDNPAEIERKLGAINGRCDFSGARVFIIRRFFRRWLIPDNYPSRSRRSNEMQMQIDEIRAQIAKYTPHIGFAPLSPRLNMAWLNFSRVYRIQFEWNTQLPRSVPEERI